MIWQVWWAWMALALGLAILELLAPGFIFLGFAIGAAGLGLLLWLGFTASLPWLMAIGAGLSLAAWLLLRVIFGPPGHKARIYNRDEDVND